MALTTLKQLRRAYKAETKDEVEAYNWTTKCHPQPATLAQGLKLRDMETVNTLYELFSENPKRTKQPYITEVWPLLDQETLRWFIQALSEDMGETGEGEALRRLIPESLHALVPDADEDEAEEDDEETEAEEEDTDATEDAEAEAEGDVAEEGEGEEETPRAKRLRQE